MRDDAEAERRHWNERYASRKPGGHEPSEFLVKYAYLVPRAGLALDIACGTGENALFLGRYLDVVGIDVSDVAIDMANQAVAKSPPGHHVIFVTGDALGFLAKEGEERYDLVTCINFFDPAIINDMKRVLKQGATIVIQAYTIRDERMATNARMKPFLVDEATFFEPAMFGGYWIIEHEIEEFVDKAGLHRQRVNMLARKPIG